MKIKRTMVLPALLAAAALLASCGPPPAVAPSAPAQPSSAAVQTAIAQRVESYYNHAFDNKTMATYQITTKQLYGDLKADPSKYFLMDVRKPKNTVNFGITAYGYDGNHIPGAVSIPYGPAVAKAIADNAIPKDKTIVTICYTGQWANQTAALLRLLGYHAYALHLSMSDWNQKTDVLPPKHTVPNYPLVTGTKPGTFKP
ncbi:MAG: rhodanese-like domain-containing protein [Thermaerobacter sp.]|nr:rhodanese-like domain-containing protein [Thermaerobacter sp.]